MDFAIIVHKYSKAVLDVLTNNYYFQKILLLFALNSTL